MAKLTNTLSVDVTGFIKGIGKAITSAGRLDKLKDPVVDVKVNDEEVQRVQTDIKGLTSTQKVTVDVDTKGAQKQASRAGGAIGGLLGGAISGGLVTLAASAIPKLTEAAQTADALGDNLQLSFAQAGLTLEEQNVQLARANDFAQGLSDKFAISQRESKALLAQVVGITGQTGQSAEEMTKLALGVEKASGGLVKAETFVKGLGRGIEDPAALEALISRFPQLRGVLESNLPIQEKVRLANEQLAGTFTDLERQAQGPAGAIARLQQTFDQLLQDIANPLFQAIAPLFDTIGKAAGEIFQTLTPLIASLSGSIGQLLTDIVKTLLPSFQTALAPIIALVQKLLPIIVDLFNVALQPLATALDLVANILADTLGPLFDALEPTIDQLVATFKGLASTIGSIVAQVLPTLGKLFQALLPIIVKLASLLAGKLLGVIEALLPVILSLVPVIVQLVEIATKLLVPILEAVVGVVEFLLNDLGLLDAIIAVVSAGIQGLAAVINFVLGAINGLIDVVQSVTRYLRDLVDALLTFDLGKIKNALLGLGKDSAVVKPKVEKVTKAVAETAEVTKKAAGSVDKLGGKLKKTGGAASGAADNIKKLREEIGKLDREQAKLDELEQANTIGDATQRALAVLAIERKYQRIGLEEQLAAVRGNSKEAVLQRELLNKQLAAIDRQFAEREADLRAALQVKTFEEETELRKRAAETAAAINAGLIEELQRQVEVGNVSAVSGLVKATRAGVEAELEASVDAIVESTPEFTKAADEIKRQLSEGLIDADAARRQTDELRQTILQGLLAIPGGEGNAFAEQIQKLYDDAAAKLRESEKQILDAADERRIASISSELLRGIEERVAALTKERDLLLTNTELTEEQAADITQRYGKAIDQVRTGNVRRLGDAINGVLEGFANFQFNFETQDAEAAAKELQDRTEQINEALRAGEISYQEALDQLAQLESQAADTSSAISQAFTQALQQTADAAREQVSLSLENQRQLREEARKVAEDLTLTEKQREEETERINKKIADQTTELYGQIGVAAAAAFGQAIAEGENAGEALKAVIGETARSLLAVYTPTIIAAFASIIPGPAGLIAGSLAVASLQALLGAALAGFKEGGYTGNGGVNEVAGVVHGREFVVNARATSKYRDVLEAMNSGRPLDLIAKEKSGTFVDINGGLSTVASIMADVRDRLDRIPDQALMKQQMGVDIALDDRLYERQRFRKQVRGLR
jgi:hypothetical protein